MDDYNIDFACANIFLNLLKGNEGNMVIYENPLDELLELCNKTKKVLKGWSEHKTINGIPEELPIKVNDNIGMEAYEKTLRGKDGWVTHLPTTHFNKSDTINKIMEVYSSNSKDLTKEKKEYILNDLKKEGDLFIKELDSLEPKKLVKRIDGWTSYEIENLFDKVKQPKIDKRLVILLDNYYNPTEEKNKGVRDEYKNKIDVLFNKKKKVTLNDYLMSIGVDDVSYKGKFPPSDDYIRNYLMPWIILLYMKKQPAKYKNLDIDKEKFIYSDFLKKYDKL